MSGLELKIPPPLVALVCGLAMYGFARLGGAYVPVLAPFGTVGETAAALRTLAMVLAAGGLALDASSVLRFVRTRTTVNPLKPANSSALVTGGAYRYSRNPMYLGMALLLAAWAAWLGTPWALLGIVAFVAWITRFQILPEERVLERRFGAEFVLYRGRVRRWV